MRTKLLVGFIVALLTIEGFLIWLYIDRPPFASSHKNLVDNLLVSIFSVLVVVVALELMIPIAQYRARDRVAKFAMNRAVRPVLRLLNLFVNVVKASSTTHTPDTIQSLFGEQTGRCLSLQLALDALGPGSQNWRDYLSAEANKIKQSLSSVLERYAM